MLEEKSELCEEWIHIQASRAQGLYVNRIPADNALAYHKTRECIAAGIFRYIHINGVDNPADILSKHWAMHQVWDTLKPLLFWGRNNGDSFTKDEEDEEKVSTANNADANGNETPSSTTLSRGDKRATSVVR